MILNRCYNQLCNWL